MNEVKAGKSVKDACREHGISDAMFYNWLAKYGGMEVSQVKRFKELEEENRQLKHIYAELSLDRRILKAIVEKKALRPAEKRTLVDHAVSEHGASVLRGCRILDFSRTSYADQPDPAYYRADPRNWFG